MRILRHLGFAGLLAGSLFKLMHWPGANLLVLTSAIMIFLACVAAFVRAREHRSTGTTIARTTGLFLLVSGVLHLLTIPGALLMLYGSAGAASFLLLSDRMGLRMKDVRPPRLAGLLLTGLLLMATGGLFKLMHWPTANVQLLAGLLASAAWILATMRDPKRGERSMSVGSPEPR
ncbi:MAG: hypothetical protein KIT10_12085 [Flavobacteriales bacterium]|nr:hypothetical protein [Flavobacteriales bacterium]